MALHSLKSHSPRVFERAEDPVEHQGQNALLDARARYAVLKGRAETVQDSGLRYVEVVGTPHPNVCWKCAALPQAVTPVLPVEVAEMTASSKQSSEHPVHQDLGGVGDGPVAPRTEVRKATGWCAEVEMALMCRVTSVRRRNTLGTPRTFASDQGSVVP